MTSQQDAYTLAAQAAADRARAETLQRGGATPAGPGLQSPTRRLSKNPAVRWVLSGVLLAAGTALAVDYLNTPLRAWLQYYAPVPGAGGKSAARITAEASAKPQAEIDAATMLEKKMITGPVEGQAEVMAGDNYAKAAEANYVQGNKALSSMKVVPGKTEDVFTTNSPIQIQLLDDYIGITPTNIYLEAAGYPPQLPQDWDRPTANDGASHVSVQDAVGFIDALTKQTVELSGKKSIKPYIYQDGTGESWTTGPDSQRRVLVQIENGNNTYYGFIKVTQDEKKNWIDTTGHIYALAPNYAQVHAAEDHKIMYQNSSSPLATTPGSGTGMAGYNPTAYSGPPRAGPSSPPPNGYAGPPRANDSYAGPPRRNSG